MKFILTIETKTKEELIRILNPIEITGENVEDIKNRKTQLGYRNKKKWSQSELDFLTEYYKSKRIPWIANKLMRKPAGVYAMLNVMYKKGLTKKQSRVKNI